MPTSIRSPTYKSPKLTVSEQNYLDRNLARKETNWNALPSIVLPHGMKGKIEKISSKILYENGKIPKNDLLQDFIREHADLPQYFIIKDEKDEMIVNLEGHDYARYAARIYKDTSAKVI